MDHISPARKWGMLVVLSLALAIIILDTTILNVALSAIIQDLHTDIQSIQWVITTYSLTLAALTITGGRLGDIFGRKRMFVFGAILFAVGSFIASISTNVPMLITGESIIEGLGAALMMPATASLLVTNFFGRERAIAFGVWGGIAGASAALGPILGGFLATNYSWRWGFRVNLIVVALLIIGSIVIPKSKDLEKKIELDFVGVFLSALGMLSLVFGIIESSTYGWWKAKEAFVAFGNTITLPWDLSIVPAFILIGCLILALFLGYEFAREESGHVPLVSLSLFKNRMFTTGIFTTAVMSLGQTGLIFALPVFLQSVRGETALQTGASLLPMSLGLLIFAPISAVLSKKISPKVLISAGLFIYTVGYVILYYSLSVSTTNADLIPGLAVFGIGMGLVMAQINNITLSAVEPHQTGEASGVNNTLRQVGSTLGSAILGAVLVGALGATLASGVEASTKIPESFKPQVAEAIASQASNVEFGGGAQIDATLPTALKKEIVRISHQATVDATKKTLAYGTLFAFLGFLASFLLPSTKKEKPIETISNNIDEPLYSPNFVPVELSTKLIAELIELDLERLKAGQPSLGAEIKAIMEKAKFDQELRNIGSNSEQVG